MEIVIIVLILAISHGVSGLYGMLNVSPKHPASNLSKLHQSEDSIRRI